MTWDGLTSSPTTRASCPAKRRTSMRLAKEGMRFTDYYAEASCTAGRANFITGEIPLRTGLTTVGQAGADVGIPAEACTLATALESARLRHRAVRQKSSRRLEQVPPTVHGFDEFFGYLYHLDAMSDPYWYSFPDDEDILQQVWPAQPGALLRDGHGLRHRACRVGARSANRRSSMKVRCRRFHIWLTCPTCTTSRC